jgi:2,3-diaminopropionate biosynthesis protein SbnA
MSTRVGTITLLEGGACRGGVLSSIGNTPLIRLEKLFRHAPFEVWAKLEGHNPGGSAKDRPACQIIEKALEEGLVQAGSVVVEATSGNMGIGLAQACAYHGLRFIAVVDPKTAPQNLQILRVYGAELDMVSEPCPVTGELLHAKYRRVEELLELHPGAFWPDQHANWANPEAHYRGTIREIVEALEGAPDYLFVATSTCGTLRGCADYLREHALHTTVVAVDARGSVIFGGPRSRRLMPGLGAGEPPAIWKPGLADQVEYVTDLDCVRGCHALVRTEAVLAGGSSGGVITAVRRLAPQITRGATVVAVLPDRGERYLDTVYSSEWVMRHLDADVSEATRIDYATDNLDMEKDAWSTAIC